MWCWGANLLRFFLLFIKELGPLFHKQTYSILSFSHNSKSYSYAKIYEFVVVRQTSLLLSELETCLIILLSQGISSCGSNTVQQLRTIKSFRDIVFPSAEFLQAHSNIEVFRSRCILTLRNDICAEWDIRVVDNLQD